MRKQNRIVHNPKFSSINSLQRQQLQRPNSNTSSSLPTLALVPVLPQLLVQVQEQEAIIIIMLIMQMDGGVGSENVLLGVDGDVDVDVDVGEDAGVLGDVKLF